MILITNNDLFKNNIKRDDIELKYVDTDYVGVLKKARDMIHANYKMLTHPLYGSIKPNETVYRSVLLEEGNSLDSDSVILIEDAIATATKFLRNSQPKPWPEDILDDFRVIDFDILSHTFDQIEK
ncbi:MAG: GrdX family protein [Finegoldia sp.]|nr:GrdX family protein [Finegoldia sp.]